MADTECHLEKSREQTNVNDMTDCEQAYFELEGVCYDIVDRMAILEAEIPRVLYELADDFEVDDQ